MTAKAQSSAAKKTTPNSGDGFTTFSIRLNEQQRALLLQAAALKGWTPTQLVRIAALERAIGICNTATPRTFDFKGLAAKLANLWFAPRDVEYALTEADWDAIKNTPPGESPVVAVPVPPLPFDVVFKLEQAATQGGTEFLNLLVEFAAGLTAPHRMDLPAPIDPKKIVGREE